MIPFIEDEIVRKKKWLRSGEIGDIFIIAESTPGPIAINTSTFVGYKVAGVLGSVFATIGLIIPSFIILFVISLFIDQFLQIEIINNAFLGIKAGVTLLVFNGALTIAKSVKKDIFSLIIFIVVLITSFVLTFLNSNISSIFYILGGAIFGIILAFFSKNKGGQK